MNIKAITFLVLSLLTVHLIRAQETPEDEMRILIQGLECSRYNYYSDLDSIANSLPKPDPQSDFETSDEYQGRLINQYYAGQSTLFPLILGHNRSELDSLITLRYELLRQQYPRTDVSLEKGRYDIERHVWPMTLRNTDASAEPLSFDLSLDRDRAQALNQAWGSIEVTLFEQFDIRIPRLIPSSVLIVNPATGDSIRHYFNPLVELPSGSTIYEFSPDGNYLATNGGREVFLYSLFSGGRTSLYGDWEDGPKSFAFSSTSRLLAVLTYYYILVYDTSNMSLVCDIGLNVVRDLHSISWSPDSKFLIGTSGRYEHLVMISVNPEMKLWAYRAGQDNFGSLGFSSRGHVLGTNIGLSNKVTYTKDLLRNQSRIVFRYPELIKISRLSDNFRYVASVDNNNKLYIVDVETGRQVFAKEFSETVLDIDFCAGSRFISIKTSTEIQILNLGEYSLHHRFQVSNAGEFSLSPDGGFLAVNGYIYRIR